MKRNTLLLMLIMVGILIFSACGEQGGGQAREKGFRFEISDAAAVQMQSLAEEEGDSDQIFWIEPVRG